ncbi:Nuclear receptor domain-containing protein [Meloidogyne graminicola]|uniref:Nuclear receptor domain-containing protein n=1 Tax=Meloidogyne graminicola TaxID=189291 RepID=A0A8S9ZI76_9BILA|nr:Nuclear receptor domain-containing protein [Meloidogyne graminicola]
MTTNIQNKIKENKLNNTGELFTLCAVCSDQAQGLHFGVMVCRACAAFFRRSTIAKRVYLCRYEGNCQINFREVRCSCRACRFARCISLGMDPNAVQKYRDQLGPRNKKNNKGIKQQKYKNENKLKNKEINSNNLNFEENGYSYTILDGIKNLGNFNTNNNNNKLFNNNNNLNQLLLPSAFSPINKQQHSLNNLDLTINNNKLDSGNVSATSSVFSSPLNPDSINNNNNGNLLNNQFNKNSNILIQTTTTDLLLNNNPTCKNNKEKKENFPILKEMLIGFQKLHLKNIRNKNNLGKEEMVLKEGNYIEQTESIKSETFAVSDMVKEYFLKFYSNFDSETKWTMLRNFFYPFVFSYRTYYSAKYFTNPEDTRLVSTPEKTYFDISKLNHFFNVKQCKTNPENIARVFEPVFRRVFIVRNKITELNLSELEFVGLLGLLFWNDRIDNLNNEELIIISKIRKQIFEELYELCRNGNNSEIRFCSIINLFHFCQRIPLDISNNFSLMNVAKEFEIDEFLYKFHPSNF